MADPNKLCCKNVYRAMINKKNNILIRNKQAFIQLGTSSEGDALSGEKNSDGVAKSEMYLRMAYCPFCGKAMPQEIE